MSRKTEGAQRDTAQDQLKQMKSELDKMQKLLQSEANAFLGEAESRLRSMSLQLQQVMGQR